MSMETISKGYDYSKRMRVNSQSLFLTKTKSQNVRVSDGWKTKLQSDPVSVAKLLPSIVETKIYFELNKDISLAIPLRLEGLIPELEHSKYILNLKKGWDGESADIYSPETLKITIVFLCRYLMWNIDNKGKLSLPKIYHGPEGSIDLLWNSDAFSLLININNTGNIGEFSGEIFETDNFQSSQGNFNPNCRTFEFLPSPTAF